MFSVPKKKLMAMFLRHGGAPTAVGREEPDRSREIEVDGLL